jgi:HK97 family phage major capsid protein
MPSKLVEKRNEFGVKQKKLADIFGELGPDFDMNKVTLLKGTNKDKADEIKKMNAELDDLGKECADLADIERAAKSNKDREDTLKTAVDRPTQPEGPEEVKSIGEMFMASPAIKGYRGGGQSAVAEIVCPVDVKTLMERSAGWLPESIRSGKFVEYATRPIQVLDVIPSGSVSQAAYVYMEETALTSNAAEVAEGGTYGEAALETTPRSKTVEKVAVWLPVTDEQLEDVPACQAYINQRLSFFLRQRLDYQVLRGDGSTPNLAGIVPYSGVQSQAKGEDDAMTAIFKALQLVRTVGYVEPNVIMLHPNDWTPIRTAKTTDGIYIYGSPSEAGPSRLWGLPVVQTSVLAENTGLVGDFATCVQLFMRRDVQMQVTNAHSDYFIKGKQAIRADVRCVNAIYRATGFCLVTSI